MNNPKLILIKNNIYLIIPIICVCFWALLYLIEYGFYLSQDDFIILYNSGKTILENPIDLYEEGQGYYYLPVFSLFFAIIAFFFPLSIGHYVFYIIILIFAIFMIIEYNKILVLMEVKKVFHRFIFLIIIANGFIIYRQIVWGQFKFIMVFILLFIIRRELQFSKEGKERNLNFYFINYGLFLIVVAIFPFYFILLLVYIFQDITFKDLLKKKHLQKYGIVMLMFVVQNFLFFIYPSYILSFVNLFSRHNSLEAFSFYLPNFNLGFIDDSTLYLISTIFIIFVTCGIILVKKMQIEKKFGYFSLLCLLFSIYALRLYVVLFPFVLLLFIPYLNQESKGIDFLKKNKFVILGLLAVSCIYLFDAPIYYVYSYRSIPIIRENALIKYLFKDIFIVYYPYLLAVLIMFTLFILYLKNRNKLKLPEIYSTYSNME